MVCGHGVLCYSLLLGRLLCCLCDLALATVTLVDALDYTYGHCLSHVTDSETTEGWVLREGLYTQWLLWHHLDDGGIARLDGLWVVLKLLSRTTIDLLDQFPELAGDVGCVAINNWGISSVDLTRVVQDDDL